jgi:N-acetylmuramoyl-L-alanine amidase-like protein
MATTPTSMDFVQARWFTPGRRKPIRLFVFHDMEAPEKGTTAESVANYFHTTDRRASAHYCCDSNSMVQCVRDVDTAWGAAGANDDGLHFEQAGYANQTPAGWLDPYGLSMFTTMAPVIRQKAQQYDIPMTWLNVKQVADGKTRGFCTHADVSAAFPKVSTGHTDPGPNYPKSAALSIWLGEQQEDNTMHLAIPDAPHADAGKLFLISGDGTMRQPITDNKVRDQWASLVGLAIHYPAEAWDMVVNGSATSMTGLRSLPSPQRDQLQTVFDKVGK